MTPVEDFAATTAGIEACVIEPEALDQERRTLVAAFERAASEAEQAHSIGLPAAQASDCLISLNSQLGALERRAVTLIAGLKAFLEVAGDGDRARACPTPASGRRVDDRLADDPRSAS